MLPVSVTVLCMPMTLAGKVYKLWVYGDVLCKMTPYLQGNAGSNLIMTEGHLLAREPVLYYISIVSS
ncbi:hypothetical protein DPMN_083083 [Dreissena polymorpha]|uniref:Uncharacterized protein n=1 Tax=Dreissena polymorpha TaxID=45954 RepID=A0A9D3YBZ7_DREPO|nr:hypothetical protein DPMN_083083 [Dreissena polymorpha]